ncbi:MAG TPA: hypothetical protein VKG92_04510 [Flavobacteriales bacterium]|nr:hypothetical protein [Flavobacteriales bacterium]
MTSHMVAALDATAVLNVDGIVRVKGFPLSGTRMTIMEQDGPPEVVTEGLQRFDRSLALQSAFLIAFEREGCVTKQLYFDTRVPDNALENAPFDFPFMVTLEPPPSGYSFQYAGPVGYIRYYPERGDFGYDTDYSKSADPILAERMRLLLTHVESAPLPTPIPVSAAPLQEPAIEDTDAFNILIPILSEEPVLVHPTAAPVYVALPPPPVVEDPPAAAVAAPVTPTSTPSSEVATARRPAVSKEPSPIAVKVHPPVIAARAVEETEKVTPKPIAQSHTSNRSEELIVDKRWVIKIVRLMQDGHITEYRRVNHHMGQVFYFKDGVSCSEWTYEHEAL